MRAIVVAWMLWGSLGLFAGEVRVFAAASLVDALKEIGAAYEKKSGDKVVINFGASSLLARQIEAGAPADLFVSADEARMDVLEKGGLIVAGTRTNRLSNTLVFVTAADSKLEMKSAKDLAGGNVKRIALAEPRTVPAGVYAREYLTKIGVWGDVAGKVVPTDNVRAALSAVEAGNVDVGIVYKTDAEISRKTRVILEVPRGEGPLIRYPMALLRGAKNPIAGQAFLAYLTDAEAKAVFERFGFLADQ